MARVDQAHPANADGDWFVDTRCIDCDACRQLAPGVFVRGRGQSLVGAQPGGDPAADVWRAALTCPTRSIGTRSRRRGPEPAELLPAEVDAGVWFCGYNSEDSFGANSYVARHPDGNVLVDSPRFTRRLAGPLAAMGGVAHVLLTHQDDVADADRWADHFGARVWIHEDDAHAAPYATDVFGGTDPVTVAPGLVAVPVPGHTAGSVMYLLGERHLFSGDSLQWDRELGDLATFPEVCWYSWPAQTESLARFADAFSFEWVLPGHGDRARRPATEMHARLAALVERMRVAA